MKLFCIVCVKGEFDQFSHIVGTFNVEVLAKIYLNALDQACYHENQKGLEELDDQALCIEDDIFDYEMTESYLSYYNKELLNT